MIDAQGRNIDYVRISVTDRCNYRCSYCMPPEGIPGLAHEEILSYEEILRLVRSMAGLGIRNVKLTGGEPLVRKNLSFLAARIRQIPGIEDVTLTTNGFLLAGQAAALKAAGISTVNVSIDTLDRERYAKICRVDGLLQALAGIRAAKAAGMEVRVNATVNEERTPEEILALVGFGAREGVTVRFIELMPIGLGQVSGVGNDQVEAWIREAYPELSKSSKRGHGPAYYEQFRNPYCLASGQASGQAQEQPPEFTQVGFISAVHHKFCDSCNRIRLTADGWLKPCLASALAVDVKSALRRGCGEDELTGILQQAILSKPVSHHFETQEKSGIRAAAAAGIKAGISAEEKGENKLGHETGREQRIMSQIGG